MYIVQGSLYCYHENWKHVIPLSPLNRLCAVALDPVGEGPALVLELLVLLEVDAVLGDDGDAVLVHAAGVAVEEDLHALLDDLDGLLLGELGGRLLIGGVAAHDRLGEDAAEARRQRGAREGGAQQVGGGEEGLLVVIEPGDQQRVPERVELGAAVVHELGQVLVQVAGVERVARVRLVGLVDGELRQVAVEVLHVRDVAAEADDRGAGELAQALDVGEAGEGTVRGCWKTGARVSRGEQTGHSKGKSEGIGGQKTHPGCRRQ